MIDLPMLGFTASAWFRLLLGLGFVLVAVTMVYAVERPRAADTAVASQVVSTATSAHSVSIVIESTFPVHAWTVGIDGVAHSGGQHDAWSWSDTITGNPGSELLVTALAEPGDQTPNHALRLRVGNAKQQIIWGGGDVTATQVLP